MQIVHCQVSYSKKNLRASIIPFAIILTLFLAGWPLAVTYFVPLISLWVNKSLLALGFWATLFVELAVLIMLCRLCFIEYRRNINEVKNYWLGHEGERIIENILKNYDDDKSVAFANINIPEIGRGDIDYLIIGPKGVIIVEVKNYSWWVMIISGKWLRAGKNGRYYEIDSDPTGQAVRHASAVADFFVRHGLNPPIQKLIIKIGGKYQIPENGKSVVFVTAEHDLIRQLQRYYDWSDFESNRKNLRSIIEKKAGPNCYSVR